MSACTLFADYRLCYSLSGLLTFLHISGIPFIKKTPPLNSIAYLVMRVLWGHKPMTLQSSSIQSNSCKRMEGGWGTQMRPHLGSQGQNKGTVVIAPGSRWARRCSDLGSAWQTKERFVLLCCRKPRISSGPGQSCRSRSLAGVGFGGGGSLKSNFRFGVATIS